jgi:putative membrane protein
VEAVTMPSLLDLATRWQLDAGLLASALAVLVAYLWGATRRQRWPAWRTACFALGVLAVLAALQSGLEAWDAQLLSIHMAQHLLLVMVAAPLLIAGAPVTLALRALPRDGARTLARALRSRPVRLLTHPLAAWTLFAAITLLTHLTAFYALALRTPAVHALEHLLYLGSALLFWLPALGSEPLAHRLGALGRVAYVVAAMPAMAVVGIALVDAGSVRYTAYVAPARALGVAPLADQRAAGMLMWAGSAVVAAVVTVLAAWSALLHEERRQLARERRAQPAPASARSASGAAPPIGDGR